MDNRFAKILSGAVLAAGVLALFGCGSSSSVQQAATPQLRIVKNPQGNAMVVLPDDVREALAQVGAPAASTTLRGAKRASVALPYFLPADQAYSAGDAGWIKKSDDVAIPGPLGGADMAPDGTTYPDNFSYIIYRLDDITQTPDFLDVQMGLTSPGTKLGVAVYDWSYGSNGQWEPVWYDDPGLGFGVDLGLNGEDYTNGGDDLAVMVFALNPSQCNIQGFNLDGGGGGGIYDEDESGPNGNDGGNANGMEEWESTGVLDWTGSLGSDITYPGYDGDSDDWFAFAYNVPANVGDVINLNLGYDNSTGNFTMTLYAADGPQLGFSGDGDGSEDISYTVTGTEQQPFFINITGTGFGDYVITGDRPWTAPSYDEVEPNEDDTQASPLPALPFSGYFGNVGLGGTNDGLTPVDVLLLSVAPGTTLNYTLNYDGATDYDQADGSGTAIFFIDQQFWLTQDQNYLAGFAGTGGVISDSFTLDPTWNGPFYVAIQDDNTVDPLPPTDYTLSIN
jgi:hypothetical protein